MKGKPDKYRGGIPDGIIEGAWNPATGKNDLSVVVSGERLEWCHRNGLLQPSDAQNIKLTVQDPDSVYEAVDDDLLYYHAIEGGARRLFYVRVRPTGNRAFAWGEERADPNNIGSPISRGGDRMRRRVK